jgi:ribosome-associated protein
MRLAAPESVRITPARPDCCTKREPNRMALNEVRAMVLAAAAACDEKKGIDTRVLELDPIDSGFTDFFVITSGANTRQTQAIADEVELRLKRNFNAYPNSVEGRRVAEWILLDYVDFVVHVFLEEKRAFYDIERLRKSARKVDLDELTAALTRKTLEVRKKAPAKTAAKKAAATKPAVARKTPKKSPAKAAKKAPAKKAASKRTKKNAG